MKLENSQFGECGLMGFLSQISGGTSENDVLIFPETFGEGYIKVYDLGPLLKLAVNQYELKEDLTLKRPGVKAAKDLVTFSFRNLWMDKDTKPISAVSAMRLLSSVQVSSADVDIEIFTPAKTKRNTILITVHVDLLKDLLNKKESNSLLDTIISGSEAYLYDEFISPEMQHLAARIFEADTSGQLSDFYLKIKAQELIYLFFTELLKRETVTSYPMNASDVKMMYLIRDKLTSDLSIAPNLTGLTLLVNMSESKMNRLFRQIFGTSIYNFHQTLRLNEAAYLLKEEKISVSEAGYRLGFTNLSHFSRIFERQFGLKPKKYSGTPGIRTDVLH